MKMRLGTLVLMTALASSTFVAAPAVADDAGDAKMHYQKATAHYAVGEYHDAAIEYEEAYKAKQDPALLYNAAQSHRLANDNQKALLLYKNIVKLYPTSKYAVESKDRIDKLSAAIATTQSPPNQPAPVEVGAGAPSVATPSPAAPPPAGAVQPIGQPAPTASPVPAAPPPSAPAATVAAAPPPTGGTETPVYEKWWFWTAIGVVVVGAVVVVAASSGSTTPWNNAPTVMGRVR
jgi:tetratricopeptide (TPR) repeat protein